MKRNKRYAYGGGIYGADEGAGANPQQSMTPPAATPPATPPAATPPVASPATPPMASPAASPNFTASNRVGQMMANSRAQNAAINSSSYTGNAANAPTLNKIRPAQPMGGAAQRERARTTAYLGGSSANTPPPAGAQPDARLQAAMQAAMQANIRDTENARLSGAGAGFRKGGNVKAYAKGGKVSSASSRGDGIASKGKTRGKMC